MNTINTNIRIYQILFVLVLSLIISSCCKDDTNSNITDVSGHWVGTYTCQQGLTGVVLDITQNGRNLEVLYNFYGVESNPGVPFGIAKFTGTIDENNHLILKVDKWLREPAGWQIIDFEADLVNGNVINGVLSNQNCAGISVTRSTIDSKELVGIYMGSYTCAQGKAGLTLSIVPISDYLIEATFEFYSLPGTNNSKAGKYKMTGIYDGKHIDLEQVEWIQKPSNYNMVDLEAITLDKGKTLKGKICGNEFEVAR